MIRIRPAVADDSAAWLELRWALWPESPKAEHREEIGRYFADESPSRPAEVLLAENERGQVIGFAELAIRPYAEGCLTNRVVYLEGWFVDESVRRQGVGRALIAAAEEWGRSQGCSEFASDADPENHVSIAAHRATGFSDVGLVRCFRKDLQT